MINWRKFFLHVAILGFVTIGKTLWLMPSASADEPLVPGTEVVEPTPGDISPPAVSPYYDCSYHLDGCAGTKKPPTEVSGRDIPEITPTIFGVSTFALILVTIGTLYMIYRRGPNDYSSSGIS